MERLERTSKWISSTQLNTQPPPKNPIFGTFLSYCFDATPLTHFPSSLFWATLCVSLARTTFMSCTDHHHLSPSPHLSSCPSSSLPLLPSRAEKFGRGSQVFPMKPSSESESGSGSQMKSGGFWTSQSESGLTSRDDEELASANLRNLSKLILPPLGVSGYNQTQINNSGRIISPMDSRYR